MRIDRPPTSTVLECLKLLPSLLDREPLNADSPVSEVGIAFARGALGVPAGPDDAASGPR